MVQQEQCLVNLFLARYGCLPSVIRSLPGSGSSRKYFRLSGGSRSAIGAYNPDPAENRAFTYLSSHFRKKGLNVPEIYGIDSASDTYLLEDLGNQTLYQWLTGNGHRTQFAGQVIEKYRKTIDHLIMFQSQGHKDLDYSVCYPRPSFDEQSMRWDMNYFKYYFLKLAAINMNEQRLEEDFQTFASYLLQAPSDFFLYRDFQSRNIMLYKDELYFIDYQGGRRGALQYDLASLLFDAKADLSPDIREEMLEHYMEEAERKGLTDRATFLKYYYPFVFMRIMQALGAYGFRGFYERKEHFLLSVPYAIKNLSWLTGHKRPAIDTPELFSAFERILDSPFLKSFGQKKLVISISSFSYKNGIPTDETGHGGGYVFDCRALPNPGRLPEYEELSGLDQPVRDYLRQHREVADFMEQVEKIIFQSIDVYLNRDFTSLSVYFGCTGGRHRSVYCSEQLAARIKEKFDNVSVAVRHREI